MSSLGDRTMEGEGRGFSGASVGPAFARRLNSSGNGSNSLSGGIGEKISSLASMLSSFRIGLAWLTRDSSNSASSHMKLSLSDRERDMMEFYPREDRAGGARYEDAKGLGGCRIQ